MIRKKTVFGLAVFTLLGFSLSGVIINWYFLENPLSELFKGKAPLFNQIFAGLTFGVATALLGWQIVRTKLLKPVRSFFVALIQSLNLSIGEIIFISTCAGIGEEILFRGAIQPFLGVWLTAIVFVAIHGYLNPLNWRLSLYGIYMTAIIGGMGYLTIYLGLVAAITAHIAIDIVLLTALARSKSSRETENNYKDI